MAILISADDIKTTLPGYAPEKSGDFHAESVKLADKQFYYHLKESKFTAVILMSGGPASGKTEFLSEYLLSRNYLIFDGILPSERGAQIKINRIKKANQTPIIYAIWPANFKQAYVAFLHRDRKFDDEHFFQKHSSSRQTLLSVAQNFPELEIKIIKNAYLEDDLSFTELSFDTRDELIVFLKENQYNVEDIVKIVTE